MSPVPHAATLAARRSAWARVLVLLLALLVPGGYAPARTPPPAVMAGDIGGAGGLGGPGGGTAAEYDLLGTALRTPVRATRRPAAPRHPAPPFPRVPRPSAAGHPVPAPPPFPRSTRSVVLRC